MTLEQGIKIAFFLAFLSYLVGVVWVVRRKNQINRRLETAKENHWVVEGHCVKSKIENAATHEDYDKGYRHTVFTKYYEYEIDGVSKRVKLTSGRTMPHCRKFYYDAEKDNQLLDTENDYPLKASLIIPVIVFIAVILIFKLWI